MNNVIIQELKRKVTIQCFHVSSDFSFGSPVFIYEDAEERK